MLKTVILDLGKVIVPFDFQRAFSGLEKLTGVNAQVAREQLMATGWLDDVECGRLNGEQFRQLVCRRLNCPIPTTAFIELWNSIFDLETLLSEEFIADLARHYRLVLLSNTSDLHFVWLQRQLPLLRHFHEFVLSYQVGAMKPNSRMFLAAIKAAKCRPEEAFYTDDIPDYVAAGKSHGLHAVVFQNQVQTAAAIEQVGAIR
jgi:glucose-1-phosphatase